MSGWLFPVIIVLLLLSAVALIRPSADVVALHSRVRKFQIYALSVSAIFFIGVVVFISTFSYASEYLTSVLSADFITGGRTALKLVFGTESVFTSLQMLGALSLFLFSFASCACCVYCMFYFVMRCRARLNGEVRAYSRDRGTQAYIYFGKRFALLSRYLI